MTNPLDAIEDKPETVVHKPQYVAPAEAKKTPIADKLRELGVDPIGDLVSIERAVKAAYTTKSKGDDGVEHELCDLDAAKFRAKIFEFLQNQLVAEVGAAKTGEKKTITLMIPSGFDEEGNVLFASEAMGSIGQGR